MEKSLPPKRHYWAIVQGKRVLFEGSFKQCWTKLMVKFAKNTLEYLELNDIRIMRNN